MDAGLGRKGAFADVRRVPVGCPVETLVERARYMREILERRTSDANLELAGKFRLEFECRYDRHKVGIAAALAQPVQRALNLARAGAYCGKGVCHSLFSI